MATEKFIKNKIRELRFFAGEMTQKELAQKAGVSRQTIIAIEGGNYNPSLELAFKIADVFEVPITEVFTYEASESNKRNEKKNT